MPSGKVSEKTSQPIQSVRRAVRVIEQLAVEKTPVAIGQLSKKIGLHVSTTHRLLATLKGDGFVQQDPTSGRYALGFRLILLGQQYLEGLDLRQVARPFLEELSQQTGETAHLVVLSHGEALYLDKVEAGLGLRITSRIGERAPLHCTAAGKILLAGMSETELEQWLAEHRLDALTAHSLTDPAALKVELEKGRRQGFSLDLEECEAGACCIAAPVRNSRGDAVAAVSISGPTVRMQARRIQEYMARVARTGRRISEQLGHHAYDELPESS
ncbi:MAG TPA: IclR family transcriptional regulator [Candidatus Methylomirabilis sp.]|nr:IclR family transcriptional regulator [Candidatus Methylomirabilis sp.]